MPRNTYALMSLAFLIALGCTRLPVDSLTIDTPKPEKFTGEGLGLPDFGAATFSDPTRIDNPWFPLKPGTRLVWDGTAIDDEGDLESHSVSFVVTDLTKVIDGVETVVCWDRDFVDGELEENEIVFFAQDDAGNVWHFGQYPEEISDGEIEATPGWLHGVKDGYAGIYMPGDPQLGDPDFSQGWAPSVPWTDRAKVSRTEEAVVVAAGDYKDVLVFEEWSAEEPDGRQLKYYAKGVGVVKIGFSGDDPSQEQMDLVKIVALTDQEMESARAEARNMEKRAVQHCADVFQESSPIKRPLRRR